MEFAEQEFKLGHGEGSLRAKLESVARQTGQEIPELANLLELPDSMKFVWMYFIELNNSRTSNGYGANPIQYSEMESYFNLLDIKPMEWEIQVIKRLDNIVLRLQHEEAEKQEKQAKQAKKQQNKSKK